MRTSCAGFPSASTSSPSAEECARAKGEKPEPRTSSGAPLAATAGDGGEQEEASARIEKLRAAFEKAGDEVNLLWLKLELEGVSDLQQMAAASGRTVAEFYDAAKRRKRALQRLLANEQGVEWVREES